jgi:hypothetical protein
MARGGRKFVLCIRSGSDKAALEPSKVYRVLLDPEAERDSMPRVIDESGVEPCLRGAREAGRPPRRPQEGDGTCTGHDQGGGPLTAATARRAIRPLKAPARLPARPARRPRSGVARRAA